MNHGRIVSKLFTYVDCPMTHDRFTTVEHCQSQRQEMSADLVTL
jgi:hypothetical protein